MFENVPGTSKMYALRQDSVFKKQKLHLAGRFTDKVLKRIVSMYVFSLHIIKNTYTFY